MTDYVVSSGQEQSAVFSSGAVGSHVTVSASGELVLSSAAMLLGQDQVASGSTLYGGGTIEGALEVSGGILEGGLQVSYIFDGATVVMSSGLTSGDTISSGGLEMLGAASSAASFTVEAGGVLSGQGTNPSTLTRAMAAFAPLDAAGAAMVANAADGDGAPGAPTADSTMARHV